MNSLAWSSREVCSPGRLARSHAILPDEVLGKVVQVGQVEFYFALVSPYSYLAYGRANQICHQHGPELVLRPMLLGAVHKAVGLRAPIYVKSKGSYQLRDIHRWAEYYGLPMEFPDPFPFRTLKTMRAAVALEGDGDLEPFTREAFGLYWEEGGAPKGFEEAD